MSTADIKVIEATVQKTHEWIAATAGATHLSPVEAYRVLRAVLHTLRDRLPVEDAAHFSAQLPMLIRGIFFEGWRPSQVPKKLSRQEFLDAVQEQIVGNHFIDPVRITANVLEVISSHLTPGEMLKVKRIMPSDLQSLWPEAAGLITKA